jgi:ectoine hydroxylase-related dioxygenase (phytanoyl-CoA dioxygenase family)
MQGTTVSSAMPSLTETQKFFFECNGYLVVNDALSVDELMDVKKACDEVEKVWRANVELPGVRRWDLDQVIAIMEYDPIFVDMLVHPPVFNLVHELLGPDINVLDHDYFISPAGATIHKGWHYDEGFPGVYHPRSRLMIKVFYVLQDIPPDGGATVFLPGSHCFRHDWKLPNTEVPEEMSNSVKMDLPAGSAYLMAGRLFHCVGNNLTKLQRKLLLYTYGHKWMRVWDGYEPSQQLIARASTPMLRQLLGLTDPYGPNAERDVESEDEPQRSEVGV